VIGLAGKLTPVQEEGGVRHYLNGEPVHAGDSLELLGEDGTWQRGRYEWNWRRADEPSFHCRLNDGSEASLTLLPAATLRWPDR
jgi:hypothetical protein